MDLRPNEPSTRSAQSSHAASNWIVRRSPSFAHLQPDGGEAGSGRPATRTAFRGRVGRLRGSIQRNPNPWALTQLASRS